MASVSIELWVAAAALIALAGCRGDRTPPLRGSDGVIVSSSDGVTVSLDEARVPVVPGCADGELVYRASGGWACASPDTLFAAIPIERQPVAPEVVGDLAARVTDLEVLRATLDRCAVLPEDLRPPNYVISPASCLVTDSTGAANDAYHLEDGWLVMHMAGAVTVNCALTERCDGSDGRWDRASFMVRDPDGAAGAEVVRGAVHASFAELIPRCGSGSPCDVTSSIVGSSTMTLDLGAYEPRFLEIGSRQYYLRVELRSAGGGAAFGGAIIE